MILDAADIYAGEGPEKIARALTLYTLEEVQSLEALSEGYHALDLTFGARGEIERFDLLKSWHAGSLSPPDAPIMATYHMVLARDAAGRLAGVRDCFLTLDRAARRCVALLSHALVLPEHRRTGLAALLRAVPVALARRTVREAGLEEQGQQGAEILLVAEMDPVDPADRATVVRLFAYGRAGFAVIPPPALPYAQPDFRDTAALGVTPTPLPLLPLVRQVGEEEEQRADVSRVWIEAYLHHIQAVHRCDVPAKDLLVIREHALAGLAAYPHDPVPLLRLPTEPSQIAALQPLLRSAYLPLFPPAWRGVAPLDEPARELERLLAAWPHKAGP